MYVLRTNYLTTSKEDSNISSGYTQKCLTPAKKQQQQQKFHQSCIWADKHTTLHL